MSGITGTLLGGGCIGANDGRSELSTGLILPEGSPDARGTQDAAKHRSRDVFEDLAS